ncbi:hypothetical protein [Streptomyces hyaluromycini]|nr:hypothetical protein [Streptomyces hyaluromycini]
MSSQTGPCARCHQPTIRYAHGANPLCPECLEIVRAARGGKY